MRNGPGHVSSAELDDLLRPFLRTPGRRYESASWLRNPFDSDIWIVESITKFEIDWRVRLPSGALLTSPKYRSLLEPLKCWLVARTHVDTTGGRIHARSTERNMLMWTIHCIDYLLLRAEHLELEKHGLAGLSENDLKAMVSTIGGHRSAIVSIYQWPEHLGTYLRSQIATLASDALDVARQLHRDFDSPIPATEERLTSLDDDEIVKARAWLAVEEKLKPGKNGFRLSPRNDHIASAIYAGTLFGRSLVLPVPVELCLGPEYRCVTERPRARVRSLPDIRVGERIIKNYVGSLAPLALVRAEGMDAPHFQIDELRRFISSIDTKSLGRYRTVPQEAVFRSLRAAIEFALEYGEPLVDSYLALAAAANSSNQSIASFTETTSIQPFLSEPCVRLGVHKWSIDQASGAAAGPPLTAEQWYCELRANAGLYETLRVLYGAIQLTVGLLTARRVGELLDLVAGESLDESGARIVFFNRKSGIGDLRDREARPIPAVGARLIRLIERIQRGLIGIGTIPAYTNLFSPPRKTGGNDLTQVMKQSYGEALDLFCDWMEMPLDPEGKRYYLRQHQLRRFFAMLFFWGGGFGGMDTLRWFLGHTDAQHLWHYITEATPGAAIRSVAAEWVAYGVTHGTKEAELLSVELHQHFGTGDFTVLEEEALVTYLEDLMEEGRLIVEPQFLDNGRNYRIGVVLHPKVSA